eukprot:CAMPEP_0171919564 /NCGR_PEP_ID=MMETSP0993-20121228/18271_1 /TAXON_ID=483369 /ORGANISM="non described non described, Strain CCMP2098" /LENGTH=132 /DNA_ID=CAMNT_0012556261 /DNA_START=110 /DNA_END=509 /DNA_ORIENTATION=+
MAMATATANHRPHCLFSSTSKKAAKQLWRTSIVHMHMGSLAALAAFAFAVVVATAAGVTVSAGQLQGPDLLRGVRVEELSGLHLLVPVVLVRVLVPQQQVQPKGKAEPHTESADAHVTRAKLSGLATCSVTA